MAWRRFSYSSLPIIGLTWLSIIVVLTIIGQIIPAPTFNLYMVYHPPTLNHPFGFDKNGMDVFDDTLIGLAPTFETCLLGTAVSLGLGVAIGTAAGLAGGWIDSVLMRFTELMYSLPGALIAAFFVVAVGANSWTIGLALGVVYWAGGARLIRGVVIGIRSGPMMESALTTGASYWRIVVRYIVPHIVASLLVFFTFQIATLLFQMTVLLPLIPNYNPFGRLQSLSLLILTGATGVLADQAQLWGPLGIFMMTILSIMWVGDGLRAALNPQDVRANVRRRSLLARLFRSGVN